MNQFESIFRLGESRRPEGRLHFSNETGALGLRPQGRRLNLKRLAEKGWLESTLGG